MPNLLSALRDAFAREVAEVLVQASHMRVERIVSQGQSSPEGFWYDQGENEFVLLVQGAARLQRSGRRFIAGTTQTGLAICQ